MGAESFLAVSISAIEGRIEILCEAVVDLLVSGADPAGLHEFLGRLDAAIQAVAAAYPQITDAYQRRWSSGALFSAASRLRLAADRRPEVEAPAPSPVSVTPTRINTGGLEVSARAARDVVQIRATCR